MMKKFFVILLFLNIFLAFGQDGKENADFRLAVKLYDDKLYDLALEQFKRFIELYPNTQLGIQSRYHLGLTQFQLKKYIEAKNTLQNFAVNYQQHTQSPNAWWKVAECFIAMDNFNDAANAFKNLKIFHPSTELAPNALLKSAECFIKINDFDNAQLVLKTLIQEYGFTSYTHNARFLLGSIYTKLDLNEKAIIEYKRISDENSPLEMKFLSRIALAKIYSKIGKIDLAVDNLKQILESNAQSDLKDSANYELGLLYEDLGDYQSAKIYYQVLVDSSAANPDIKKLGIIHLANLNIKNKEYQQALKYLNLFENSFKDDNLFSQIWFLFGEAYRKIDDLRNSNEYYKKVIASKEQSQNRRSSYIFIALNCEKINNFYEAVNFYNGFINEYPADPVVSEALLRAGKIYLENIKDYRKSISMFESILSKYSFSENADDAQYFLGLAYESNKEFDRALNNFTDLVQHYPNSEYLEEAINKIEYVNTFISQNNADGFKKIGSLLQDVISDKPKGEISYKLGEVYFRDLKDYKSASAQFDVTLSSNVNDSLKEEAFFMKAMSLFNIALSDTSLLQETIRQINDFITKYPKSTKREEAITSLYKIRLFGKKPSEIVILSNEFMKNYASHRKQDLFIFASIKAWIELKSFDKAIDLCNQISTQFRSSNYLESTLFYNGYANLMLNRDTSAMGDLKQYIEKYPQGRFYAKSLYYLATINRKQKEFQKAIDRYNEILKKYYYCDIIDSAQSEIANSYFESGDYKSAYRIYSQVQAALFSNPFAEENSQDKVLFKIALSYEKINDFENAKKYYRFYILKYKDGLLLNDAIFNLGSIYQKEGKKDLAMACFKQIKSNSPDVRIALKIAEMFYNNGQYQEALAKYSDIATNTKEESIKQECDSKIIVINYKLDNIIDGLSLEKSFKDKYNNVDIFMAQFDYERGHYYHRAKNYEMAKKIFLGVVDDYDKSEYAGWSMYWVGKIEEGQNQESEAIKVFEWINKNFIGTRIAARANFALGNIYFRNEKYDESVKFYRSIVDKPVDEEQFYLSALNNVIESYDKLNLYDAAIEYCRKFINLFPNEETILDKKLKIGILYKQLKYFDQAIIHFQSLLDLVDQNTEPEIRYYIGECYFSKTDFQQSLLEFLKIPYLSPKKTKVDWIPPSYYMAGQCYEKMNKYEQAITMYQQIIDKPGIDNTFKSQAIKEIDRVKTLLMSDKK